jgi:hypothetical protein
MLGGDDPLIHLVVLARSSHFWMVKSLLVFVLAKSTCSAGFILVAYE